MEPRRSSSAHGFLNVERRLENKYNRQFKVVFAAIRQLMSAPETKRGEIGFHVKDENKAKARKR